ncbi:MAG: hypothetical protein K2X32_02825 [Phycisphaerales bacterium]|nr:hypothetical protein [Phycisphaerales bacterium]
MSSGVLHTARARVWLCAAGVSVGMLMLGRTALAQLLPPDPSPMDAIRWADEAFAPLEPHFDRARWSLTDFQRQRLRAFIRHEIRGINRAMLARAGDEDTPEQREARREEVRVAQAALEKVQAADRRAWEQRGLEREPRDWSYLPLADGATTSYDLPAVEKYLAEIEATGAWTMLDAVFARGSVVSLIDERGLENDPEPEEAFRRERPLLTSMRCLNRAAVGSMRLAVSRVGQAGSAEVVELWGRRVMALTWLAEADRSLLGQLVSESMRRQFLDELTFLWGERLLSQRACEIAIAFLGQPRSILGDEAEVEMYSRANALEAASVRVRFSIPQKRRQIPNVFRRDGVVTRTLRELTSAYLPPENRALANGVYARLPDWPELRQDFELSRRETVGALEFAIAKGRAQRTLAAGVKILMAIGVHHGKTGTWPGALDDLVPGSLDALPADEVSGRAWRYQLLATPDDTGRPFLLYSVGLDRDDNGGNGYEYGWRTALESARLGVGFDYVVNEPRNVQEP